MEAGHDTIYSDIILDYYKNPVNFGKIRGADIEAHGGNVSCGDTVELYIKIGKEKGEETVKEITFTGVGCAISRAGACVITEIVKGKKIDEVLSITPQDIYTHLGGVIQTRIKCSLLGLNVVKKALSEWKDSKKKPKVLKVQVKI